MIRFYDENQIQTQNSFLIIDFAKKNDAISIFSMNFVDFENMIYIKSIRVKISLESSFDSRRKRN